MTYHSIQNYLLKFIMLLQIFNCEKKKPRAILKKYKILVGLLIWSMVVNTYHYSGECRLRRGKFQFGLPRSQQDFWSNFVIDGWLLEVQTQTGRFANQKFDPPMSHVPRPLQLPSAQTEIYDFANSKTHLVSRVSA